ncbi:transposase [Endozoicomonas atrinae]|uniref:transposase n=1 Tax=Endozoicomonas atrinae TaxID=1333660 RepID=UPI003AFF9BEB
MSVELDEKLVDQIASQIKTQDDLADLSRLLLKAAVERVMAAELENHLGYAKHSLEGHNSGNSRKSYSQIWCLNTFQATSLSASVPALTPSLKQIPCTTSASSLKPLNLRQPF